MVTRRSPSPRPPIDGGIVAITGASSGIGLELARELAPRARLLVAVARRGERLDELKGENSRPSTPVSSCGRSLATSQTRTRSMRCPDAYWRGSGRWTCW